MNKQEIINQIALDTRMPLSHVERVLDAFSTLIIATVMRGDDVKLIPLGTFTSVKRKARMGHNPKTKQPVHIPSMWSPKFRAGGAFRENVRGAR